MDPFTSEDIFGLKETSLPDEDAWHGFKLDTDLQSESLRLSKLEEVPTPDLKSGFLRLSIDNGSSGCLDSSRTASLTSESEKVSHLDDDSDYDIETDIWDASALSRRQPKHGLLDWDHFNRDHTKDPVPRYLSEAGEAAYDAVIGHAWRMENGGTLRYASLDHFRQAVVNVLLGRSSLVFEWHENSLSFETQFDKVTLVGHSADLMATLCRMFCACGSSFRSIQTFCQDHKPTNPTTFATQSSLLQILNAIEADLLQVATSKPTIMKLKEVSTKHAEIYEILQPIVAAIQSLKDESRVLAIIIRHIAEIWASNTPLRPVLTNLADRVLQPGVRGTCEEIGLGETTPGVTKNNRWAFADLLPECVSMFEDIPKCLQVSIDNGVQIHHLFKSATTLQMVYRWSDIVQVQNQADLLETESRGMLENRQPGTEIPTMQYACSGDTGSIEQNPFDVNFRMFPSNSVALDRCSEKDARLSQLMLATLTNGNAETEPEPELSPVQMLEMSLRPVLSVQHRICSYALMRSLFLQHNLVSHLELLHAYQLFGNGSFVTRLSRALFDTSQNSAQGRRKAGLTAGLRLENREVWPPASSELRFVLIGLLSESSNEQDSRNMLDSISFAIRDLSEEDLLLCRDVHSIHALDFLRLTYAPPNSVLELIITPSVLEKYDRIFKFLLVLLRMHAFSQSLVMDVVRRDAKPKVDKQYHRFCLHLHHFTATFLDYALNVAIGMPWGRMRCSFKAVHDSLSKEDYDHCMSVAGSISQICEMHEDTLDEILAALFLKKSQAKLFTAGCEIFKIGLDSARDDTVPDLKHSSTTHHKNIRQALDDWYLLVSKNTSGGRDHEFQITDHLLIKFDHLKYR